MPWFPELTLSQSLLPLMCPHHLHRLLQIEYVTAMTSFLSSWRQAWAVDIRIDGTKTPPQERAGRYPQAGRMKNPLKLSQPRLEKAKSAKELGRQTPFAVEEVSKHWPTQWKPGSRQSGFFYNPLCPIYPWAKCTLRRKKKKKIGDLVGNSGLKPEKG